MTRNSRSGFTLVEILVVVAILGVLAATISIAALAMMGNARRTSTDVTIKTVKMMLDARWKEVQDEADKDVRPDAILTQAGGHPERAKLLWRKIRLLEAFPVNYNEINNCYASGFTSLITQGKLRRYNASYRRALAARSGGSPNWVSESSACLVIALAGQNVNLDQLDANVIKDLDGDQLKEISDGWGKAIAFFRFPTNYPPLQNQKPNAPSPNPLYDPTWTGRSAFTTQIHKLDPGLYTVPVLVSGGADEQLGLTPNVSAPFDTLSVSSATHVEDNRFSFLIGGAP